MPPSPMVASLAREATIDQFQQPDAPGLARRDVLPRLSK